MSIIGRCSALAEKTYGRVKPQALPERKPQNEPEQTGIKRVTVKAPAKLPYLSMAWKVPKLNDVDKDRDPYALEVLAACSMATMRRACRRIWCAARRSRSRRAPATTARCAAKPLFVLDGQPAEGKDIAELEAALRAEFKRIQDEGVSAEELARVKTQTIAARSTSAIR